MTRSEIHDKINWLESLNFHSHPLEEHYKEVIDTMVHLHHVNVLFGLGMISKFVVKCSK